jgi:hypothetical protein
MEARNMIVTFANDVWFFLRTINAVPQIDLNATLGIPEQFKVKNL